MSFHLNSTLLDIIKLDLDSPRTVPFLAGEPAIGKTSFIKGLETSDPDTYKVFSISVNTMADKGDLTGARTLQNPETQQWEQMFFPHETAVAAIHYAENNPTKIVVLLLDEINRADSDVTSAAMTISTERRIGTTQLPHNIRLATTGNTYGNITSLDSASLTRFSIYEVKPSATQFLEIMGDRLNPWIATVLTRNPQYIFQKPDNNTTTAVDDPDNDDSIDNINALFSDDESMEQFTAPRTLEGLSNWLNRASEEMIIELLNDTGTNSQGQEVPMLRLVLEAHTGNTAFTAELLHHIAEEIQKASQSDEDNTGSHATPPRPVVYDDVLASPDRSSLDQLLSSLNTENLEQVFLYALYDEQSGQGPDILNDILSADYLTEVSKGTKRTLAMLGPIPTAQHAIYDNYDNDLTDDLAAMMDLLDSLS